MLLLLLCSRCFLLRLVSSRPPPLQGDARGAAVLAAAFHSSAAVLSKSTPRIRFSVREKRSGAKSALRKILLNGGPCQESSNEQMRKHKGDGKSKGQHSFPGKNRQSKNKCGQNWRNFDVDDGTETPYGTFGGKRSFTWYWPGENEDGGTPSGSQWRDESQSTKSRNKFWNESNVEEEEESVHDNHVEEEEESVHDNLQDHRISLGLPLLGPLKVDQINFRASALKWHPDKHQGLHKLKQRKSLGDVWKHTMHWPVPSSQVANYHHRLKGTFLGGLVLIISTAVGVLGHYKTIRRKYLVFVTKSVLQHNYDQYVCMLGPPRES